LFIGFNACEKEETTNTGDRDDATINLTGSLEISDFVWQGLNQFYYWQEAVPNLADTKDDNTTSYAQFIQSNPEPDAFFETLLHDDDRFSWIVDDYVELENSLSGIEASNGVEFILLLQCQGCPGVVGFVTFIFEGSDAGILVFRRGDLFFGVFGTRLT
ncbi:MAG: carboxyl-terminal protease, partial [Flavobacteriaceae bacterium]